MATKPFLKFVTVSLTAVLLAGCASFRQPPATFELSAPSPATNRTAASRAQILIPESWRTTHEDHFAAVMEEFVRYFHTPRAVPPWERPNALARYYITTQAVEMARGAVRSEE